MEVSLTQIFDRPLRGREFFEEVIRDNLDLGRPDRVQLVFDRVVTKKTPGMFRTDRDSFSSTATSMRTALPVTFHPLSSAAAAFGLSRLAEAGPGRANSAHRTAGSPDGKDS